MHCNFKTMIKLTAGLGVILAVAYFALPEARTWLLASTPILLALVCPVAMLAMMFGMKGKDNTTDSKEERAKPGEATASGHSRDAAPDKA